MKSCQTDALSGVAFERSGSTKRNARTHDTMLLAGFRGFLLDLCATGDRERVDAAVEVWLRSLSVMLVPAAKSVRKAR